MKLYYREVGEPTATPLLIVHGIFGSSDNWLTISKTIAAQGYRVILPDQRNHGQSPRSDEFSYVDMAADIHELITDLKLDKPILVGHSMGGKTMMQYVFTYPGTFSSLVVVDIAPKFYPVHHSEILRGLAAINLKDVSTRAEADAALAPYEPSPTVRQFLLKNLYREEVAPGTSQFAWRLNLPVITREIHGVGEELTHPHPITEPTLFIRGRRSPYILDSDWPGILRLFPSAQLATIEDAGHWVQAEKPAEFVAVLMGFLKG
ncbi:alpha/beta fold hydrolase [Fibrivirga algicola]|uniref:Alpha/beta fold hydrolase n=1 Tax=Fibrivirga algicola TaxID=2950420 RepID=A0ABX0QB67_9BACT|nr:alpha/beta fold hydrolase [Fibrivirga algicola]ARK13284.1 alpha/beta hydrolase [Fibrella sp. ES10-3-2-2]NID09113.1 alpha/beta fold hydrolase [Fibrivirga algicola]